MCVQDIARDVRETKVHYSPSEKDGVFVVEVARGADSNTPILNNHIASSMAAEEHVGNSSQNTIVEMPEEQVKCVDYASSTDGQDGHASCSKSNEEVLVHPPPNGMCTDDDVLMIDEDGTVSMSSPKLNGNANEVITNGMSASASTGLSQSDLSISSSGSNRNYTYGTQKPYIVETKGYQSSSPHQNNSQIDRATTPEPITVISDTDQANDVNEEDELKSNGNDGNFNADQLPNDNLNENVIPLDNGVIDAKLPKCTTTIADKINENGNENYNINEKLQQNGIKFDVITELNGKHNGEHENGLNGTNNNNNDEPLIEESGDFDSLMNLPAPPTCDEIKLYTDISALETGNLDSLPPPPPEQMFIGSVQAAES